MPADGEVARNASRAQLLRHLSELWQEELEDQREPHNQRLARRELGRDFLPDVADVDHLDQTSVPLENGRQITHAEIALVLIPDQRNRRTVVSRDGRLAGVAEGLAPTAAIHPS